MIKQANGATRFTARSGIADAVMFLLFAFGIFGVIGAWE